MGYLGGANFPDRPDRPRPAGAAARRVEGAVRVPRQGGHCTRSSSPATGRTPRNPAAPPATRRGDQATPSDGRVRRPTSPTRRTLRGFLDDNGLEAIGNHGFIPSTWNGRRAAPVGAMSGQATSTATASRRGARVRLDPGDALPGHRQRPDEREQPNIEPWTVAGEKWTALNELSVSQFGIHMYPHNHDAAYNFLQDGPMVTVTQDRVTGAPIAPTQVRGGVGQAVDAALPRHHRPAARRAELDIYWAHVAQHRSPLVLRLRTATGSRTSSTRSPWSRSRPALRPLPREGRRPHAPSRSASATATTWSRSAIPQRHRLRDVLPGAGREGLAQPELRAGQRPRRSS